MSDQNRQHVRIVVFLFVSVLAIGGYWWYAGPTPQPPWYHNFADLHRSRIAWKWPRPTTNPIPLSGDVLAGPHFVSGYFAFCTFTLGRPKLAVAIAGPPKDN